MEQRKKFFAAKKLPVNNCQAISRQRKRKVDVIEILIERIELWRKSKN